MSYYVKIAKFNLPRWYEYKTQNQFHEILLYWSFGMLFMRNREKGFKYNRTFQITHTLLAHWEHIELVEISLHSIACLIKQGVDHESYIVKQFVILTRI